MIPAPPPQRSRRRTECRAAGLARPVGPAEGPYAEHPMATLILHINREVMHHGAEVCLLRDLYRDTHRSGGASR